MNITLDNFLSESYPRIFIERSLSTKESCMGRGLETGNGWFPLINSLCHNIQNYIDTHNKYQKNEPLISQVVFLQVKEKFGGLRIYHSGGDAYCRGLIAMASTLSYTVCELCGDGGCRNVGPTSGWIQTICVNCAKKTKRKIDLDSEIRMMLNNAVRKDNKGIVDFYASR